jgi:predicted nucleic acid-binding protein
VDIFFDTSVLVAACEQAHPHYARAWPALRRVAGGEDNGFISAHSIAEVYAALTRLPVRPRIQPLEATRIISDDILAHFEAVPISKEDYVAALNLVGNGGWSGAKIYDALLLQCAARCTVDRIYSFNLADFRELATPDLREKISAP